MSRLLALVRVALGAVFLWAAATKLPDMAAFAEDVANYRLLPGAWVTAAAAAVVGVELLLGALLVLGRAPRAAALVAAGLLATFTVGLAQALARGIDLRCGCFGGSERATWLTVGRDVALLLGAALLLWRGPGRLIGPGAAREVTSDAPVARTARQG